MACKMQYKVEIVAHQSSLTPLGLSTHCRACTTQPQAMSELNFSFLYYYWLSKHQWFTGDINGDEMK